MTRLVYPEADMPIMSYLKEEGQTIEPNYYVPILPMILVNGSEGIGTGWSCKIPQFNPLDIIEYLRVKISGKGRLPEVKPWVRGWTGDIETEPDSNNLTYTATGIFKVDKNDTMDIFELPVNTWTTNFKVFLE